MRWILYVRFLQGYGKTSNFSHEHVLSFSFKYGLSQTQLSIKKQKRIVSPLKLIDPYTNGKNDVVRPNIVHLDSIYSFLSKQENIKLENGKQT